jgi:hypothetical protein
VNIPKLGRNKPVMDPTGPGSTDRDLSSLPRFVNEVDQPPAAEYCGGRNYHRFQVVAGTDRLQCMVCGGWADAGIERVEVPISKRQAFREAMRGKRP